MSEGRAPRIWGRRHGVLLMCFLAMFVAYSDRVNISVASVAMLEEFHWTQTVKGYVLSAFFIGYFLFMIPSGWLAARFGGKRVLGWSVIVWSLFTLLTPWAATVSVPFLIAARIGLGLGEAAVVPATYELFSRWVPENERSRAMTRFLSGIPIGQIVAFVLTGWLTGHFGWALSFYVFGAAGLIWAVYWLGAFENEPVSDRRMLEPERQLLRQYAQRTVAPNDISAWRLVFKLPVLAAFLSHFCNNWILYLLLAWLPSYFRAMGLNFSNSGLYSAAPWLVAFVASNLAAVLADRAIARGVAIVRVRKVIVGLSLLGAATFLLLVRDVQSPGLALALVCGATAAMGVGWSGFAPNLLDIAPCHGAKLVSISNTIATIPGMAGVAITGWLLDRTGTYSATFLLTASIAIAGALFYFTFASGRRVDAG